MLKPQSRSLTGQSLKKERQLSCGTPQSDSFSPGLRGRHSCPRSLQRSGCKVARTGAQREIARLTRGSPTVSSTRPPINAPGQLYRTTCRPSRHLEGAARPLLGRAPPFLADGWGTRSHGGSPPPGKGVRPLLRGRLYFLMGIILHKKPKRFSYNQGLVVFSTLPSILLLRTRGRSPKARSAFCSQAHTPRDVGHTGDTMEHTCGTHIRLCAWYTP